MFDMKKVQLTVFVALAGLASLATADVIDQNQPLAESGMSSLDDSNVSAQSFQQAANNISGAGVFIDLGNGGHTDLITIALWTTLPDGNGVMLTSASAVATEGSWVDVFWNPVSVTPGTTYFLDFSGDSVLVASGSVNDPYANGQVYAGPSYLSFPTFDFAFRTYSSDVPAPSVLGVLGVLGLTTGRRRRVC
jgi:hypothetical protein